VVPPERGGKATAASIQYQMLAHSPYVHTQPDVLFESWIGRQDLAKPSKAERARLREEFFSKPQACLRASPLAKQYGWGLVFDAKGRIALFARESKEYLALLKSEKVTVLKAMRSSRGPAR